MRYCVASCIIIWDEETRNIYYLGSGPPGRDTDNMFTFGGLTLSSADHMSLGWFLLFEAGRGMVGAWSPTGLLRAVLVRSTLQG